MEILIDNIFPTDVNAEALLGNRTNILDHLAQFLSFPLKQTSHKKKNEMKKILMLASLSVTLEILIGKKLLK